MIFPFTFNFRLPGIINPFASSSSDPLAPPPNFTEGRTLQSPVARQHPSQAPSTTVPPPLEPSPAYPRYPAYPSSYPITIPSTGPRRISRADLPKINRPRPSLSPSPSPATLSRKRGWEPDPSPSWSTTSVTLASTSGYLDTPAKYREMAASTGNGQSTMKSDDFRYTENQHVEDDMPPLKKRRGLAGSIVSTAVSAALIGTAVGLTVYRLWRDRGKEAHIQAVEHRVSESPDTSSPPPPPPYQENEWKSHPQPLPIQASSVTSSPKTIRRKRHPAFATKRPVVVYHSSRRSRLNHATSSTPAQPEFEFGQEVEEESTHGVVEDKMDWIGDKLSMLIEQGKRALNAEVVVMSDAKEDEVDDGFGTWEEDEDDAFGGRRLGRSSGPSSRPGSIRRAKKPRNIMPPPSGVGLGLYGVNASSSTSSLSSPRLGGYQTSYSPSAPSTSTTYASAPAGFTPSSSMSHSTLLFDSPRMKSHVRGLSYESVLLSTPSATQEDPAELESPEIRENMERARARLLARRAGGGGV